MINVTAYDVRGRDYLEVWQDSCFLLENQMAFIICKKKEEKKTY